MCRTACVCPCPCLCICRLVPSPGTTYDGVGGWGGMLTFMWTCRSSWCYAHGGGVGWDVNVHVNLQKQLMLRTREGGWWWWWWWWWWCWWWWWWCDDEVMMMMTLMKLVNSATKFRHGMDKFTNLIQVCAVPRAGTRLYVYVYVYLYLYVYANMV